MKKLTLLVLLLIPFIYIPEMQSQTRDRKIKGVEREAIQAPKEEKRERPAKAPDRQERNFNIPTYTPPADPVPVYHPAPDYHPEPEIIYDPQPVIIDAPKTPRGGDPYLPEITKRPTLFDLYTEQGVEYFDSGYYAEALVEFDNAMAIDSTEYALYYYRGCTLLKLDYFPDAISDLNIYIMYFPEDKDALYNRGLAWLYMDNKSIAYDDFNAAARLGDKRAASILKRFY
jgi:tetratricopeptide (TPR) repeat protein